MWNKKPVIFIGAGGHALSVSDSLGQEYMLCGFIDDAIKDSYMGLPVFGNRFIDIPDYKDYYYFVCIGDNANRKKWFNRIRDLGLNTINVIDKTAQVSSMSKIGTGNFFGKFCVVNAGVEIGDNNLLNTFALVEHGCVIGNHTNLSTNCTINGDVVVKDCVYLGSGAVCNGQLTLGECSIVGSGAVVTKDIPNNEVVVGVPAKAIVRYT